MRLKIIPIIYAILICSILTIGIKLNNLNTAIAADDWGTGCYEGKIDAEYCKCIFGAQIYVCMKSTGGTLVECGDAYYSWYQRCLDSIPLPLI